MGRTAGVALVVILVVVATWPAGGAIPGGDGAVGNETNATRASDTPEPRGTADFEVSGLSDVVAPVGGPDELTPWNGTVSVTVENTGDRNGSTWVELVVGATQDGAPDAVTDRELVTLEPGERTRVSLQPIGLISGGPGNYTVRARANGSTAEATVAVYFPRETHFAIGNLTASGFEGQRGTLHVPVENTGQPPDSGPALRPSQGPASVSVLVNGVLVAERQVWLDVGESRNLSLSVPLSAFAPGRNSVAVRTEAVGTGGVHDEVTFTVDNTTGRTEGADGPGFGPVAAVVGTLMGVGAWIGRRL